MKSTWHGTCVHTSAPPSISPWSTDLHPHTPMKIIARIELAALASLFAIGSASAVPVTGEINIISFNDPSFAINFASNTVSFGAGNNAKVTLATGSYAGLLNATAHYNNFTYDPLSVTDPLWATTSGGPAAQFSLTG